MFNRIKATSSLNLTTNPDELNPCSALDLPQSIQENGVDSDTVDALGLTTFDTFGVSENVLNHILPSLEQTWKEVLLEDKAYRLDSDRNGNLYSTMGAARKILSESLRNSSAKNATLKHKLALALELQNTMNALG